MISVIICSANRGRLEKIRENIAATIGVEHELVIITNAKEIGGICKGYNAGAAQAVFDTLCFVHDDVTFLSPDWGKRVISHLEGPAAPALVGLAGSRYKSAAVSGWASGQPAFDCCNIFQEDAQGNRKQVYLRPDTAPSGPMVPVTSLDGVLLCMPKNIWQQYPFNAEKLPGFHFYDLDISLRIAQHHTIGVIYDIDLVHYSMGNFGAEWMQHAIHFHRHINRVPLPAVARGMGADMPPAGAEQRVTAFWLNRLMKEPIGWGLRYQWVSAVNALDHLSLWPDVAKMLLYPVKKKLFERKS